MFQKVVRRTLSGSSFTKIQFDNVSPKYMVKNFSNSDIYVSFDSTATTSNSVKIPADFFQIVEANENEWALTKNKFNAIYIKGTGEVEVQQLWYR